MGRTGHRSRHRRGPAVLPGPRIPVYLVEAFQVAATVPPHRRELVSVLLHEEDRMWELPTGSPKRMAAASALKARRRQLGGSEQRLLIHLLAERENQRRHAPTERQVPCPVCAARPGVFC